MKWRRRIKVQYLHVHMKCLVYIKVSESHEVKLFHKGE